MTHALKLLSWIITSTDGDYHDSRNKKGCGVKIPPSNVPPPTFFLENKTGNKKCKKKRKKKRSPHKLTCGQRNAFSDGGWGWRGRKNNWKRCSTYIVTKLNWIQKSGRVFSCCVFLFYLMFGIRYVHFREGWGSRWAERRGRQSNGWGTIGGGWGGVGGLEGTLMKGAGVAQRKHSNGNQQVLNFSFVCTVLCLFSLYIWSSPSRMS